MPYADLDDDLALFYTDDGSGDGPPLLLVHGWGADSHQWSWHIDALAAAHRVIAVDLRGHGYSAAPARGNTPRAMAADLARLLDVLGIDQVVPVGHSMGAQVVSILAVEHPRRVARMVVVDPGYGLTPEIAAGFPHMIAALRGPHPLDAAVGIDTFCTNDATPAVVRRWHQRRLRAARPHVLAEAFEAMFTLPDSIGTRAAAEAYLARRTCPVLALWADPERAEWESALLHRPGSAVVCWPDASHRLHEERPDDFVDLVLSWLS
ncbi:MAG: alpha/beta fold hydrolase [Mycobacteriaceae bacterium]|nr:alpha/beta fold hydrolase [Mycobacteriaceae bacterium]